MAEYSFTHTRSPMKRKALDWTLPPLDYKKPIQPPRVKEDGTIDPASEWWRGAQEVLRMEHEKLKKQGDNNDR